jgi:hypothetical protein
MFLKSCCESGKSRCETDSGEFVFVDDFVVWDSEDLGGGSEVEEGGEEERKSRRRNVIVNVKKSNLNAHSKVMRTCA